MGVGALLFRPASRERVSRRCPLHTLLCGTYGLSVLGGRCNFHCVFSLKLFLPLCSGLLRQLLVLAGGQASAGGWMLAGVGTLLSRFRLAAAGFPREITGRQALMRPRRGAGTGHSHPVHLAGGRSEVSPDPGLGVDSVSGQGGAGI